MGGRSTARSRRRRTAPSTGPASSRPSSRTAWTSRTARATTTRSGRTTGRSSASSRTADPERAPRRPLRLLPCPTPPPNTASTRPLRSRRSCRRKALRPPGWGRGSSRCAGCGATAWRSRSSALFVVIVLAVPGGAAVRELRRRHRAQQEQPHRQGRARRQAGRRGHARRDAGRARRSAPSTCWAPTRTAATSRCGCSTAGATRCSWASWRAIITTLLAVSLGLIAGYFRGPSDTADPQRVRHPLVVPGAAVRDRAGHGARDRRPQPRADPHRGRLALDPDARDRVRLHPLPRAARCAARCCRCARRSSCSRPRRRAWARCASCSARSCRTSPRRSSCSPR